MTANAVANDPPDVIQFIGSQNNAAKRHAAGNRARTRTGNSHRGPFASRARENLRKLFRAFRKDHTRRETALHVAGVGEEGLNLVWL